MGLQRENMLISPGIIAFLKEEMFELSTKEEKGVSQEKKRVEGFPGKKNNMTKSLGETGYSFR